MLWPTFRRSDNSESTAVAEVEKLLELCTQNVLSIESLVSGGNLLNQRQCADLSTKLADITTNIRTLQLHSREFEAREVEARGYLSFREFNVTCCLRAPLENLHRCLEKAKLLVHDCAKEEWWVAAVFQIHNENAFRGILLEVWLCYIAIYEEAKRTGKYWTIDVGDLRKSSVFSPTSKRNILLDQEDLRNRLEDLANVEGWNHCRASRGDVVKHCLAKYLLGNLTYLSEQSQTTTSNACSPILWEKQGEPPRTWGRSTFLGAGSSTSGVYGTVWLGIPCARKQFHGEDTEPFFLKEASILAHLRHPHIIKCFCCGKEKKPGDHFIAMELMEKSLSKLIEDQKGIYFSIPVAVDIIVQIAQGMCYLHDQNIAHRDLKPQNVVVTRLRTPHLEDHYCVKLVDFASSKTKVEVSKSNTMTAVGIGTTMYRAPEVLPKAFPDGIGGSRKAIWLKADVFSFAMTCAHILSLKRPFEDRKIHHNQLYNELLQETRPYLPHKYPKELIDLIKDCWDFRPRSRPSFLDVWIRLEKLRHKIMRGLSNPNHPREAEKVYSNPSYTLIQSKLEEQSSIQKSSIAVIDDEAKDNVLPLISCAREHELELYKHDSFLCTMCSKDTYTEDVIYHCQICQFDAHPDCAEIKNDVKVFFHDDPLHLLGEHHYNNYPDAACSFCWESLQETKWIYRCEECDYDVHARCTKYSKTAIWHKDHPHPLTLKSSPPRKNAFCKCCNGYLQGYWYSCTQRQCEFDLHPFCSILPRNPFCIYSNLSQHRLSLITAERHFMCNKCGGVGFSWYYYCEFCKVHMHVDCLDDTDEAEEGALTEVYEKLILEYGISDDHTKIHMVIKMLDTLLVNDTSKPSTASESIRASSSSSLPSEEVATKARPKTQTGMFSSNRWDDVNLRKKIAADIVQRKAKRKEGKIKRKRERQISKANLFEMLGSLEKSIIDLQSSKSRSKVEAKILETALEKIKKRQHFLFHEMTTIKLAPPNMHRGPQLCLFYLEKNNIKTVLNSLEQTWKQCICCYFARNQVKSTLCPNVLGTPSFCVMGYLESVLRNWSRYFLQGCRL